MGCPFRREEACQLTAVCLFVPSARQNRQANVFPSGRTLRITPIVPTSGECKR